MVFMKRVCSCLQSFVPIDISQSHSASFTGSHLDSWLLCENQLRLELDWTIYVTILHQKNQVRILKLPSWYIMTIWPNPRQWSNWWNNDHSCSILFLPGKARAVFAGTLVSLTCHGAWTKITKVAHIGARSYHTAYISIPSFIHR